ncbi:hypothetical protein MPTK1_7g14400 [Marchantia polymorpha subsp. ruderalis]|uniref:WAT1-related protein n=2 Tax=Marchantia polymorpha TaxID=3197 RepID=A0AAF6BZJ0_MARPO|nr:hypothetical protein MARPO_0009s0125 [Marchantia polymorpha]BBN17424.1 hypothetical protein Mp_7g14400 [Marchantia polymorpha subsp. ruderalis]|eukprot:PTQ47028.1 hypothetical protein MARPO_0009s0125 [Marchantia polymorpha]
MGQERVNGSGKMEIAAEQKKRFGCVDWFCNGTGKVHAALMMMQLGFAGHQILSRVALTSGLSQFVYAIYRNGLALIIMGPFAYVLEKKDRPPMTLKLMYRFFLLGLTGIVGSQQLFLAGLIYTSATFAATMQNAVPVITFLMAMMLGLEKVRIGRLDGQAKVLGTVVCVAGAILMSVYKGPAVYHGWAKEDGNEDLHKLVGHFLGSHLVRFGISQWQLGGILLLINCISWAAYLIMQAPILKVCPTPLTITAFTYFFGSLQVGVLMFIVTGGKINWSLSWGAQAISVAYAGVISSGINFSLQSWAIQKGGPLLVSLYTPVQTIIVAFLSVLLLGDSLYLGSLVGGSGAVLGLYLVTWGQVEHRKRDALEIAAETKNEDLEASAHPHFPTSVSSLTQPLLNDQHGEDRDQKIKY